MVNVDHGTILHMARPGGGCATYPCGPPEPSFGIIPTSQIPINTETLHRTLRTIFLPPQASVLKRSHQEPYSGAPPKGETIVGGFLINLAASMMMCE